MTSCCGCRSGGNCNSGSGCGSGCGSNSAPHHKPWHQATAASHTHCHTTFHTSLKKNDAELGFDIYVFCVLCFIQCAYMCVCVCACAPGLASPCRGCRCAGYAGRGGWIRPSHAAHVLCAQWLIQCACMCMCVCVCVCACAPGLASPCPAMHAG